MVIFLSRAAQKGREGKRGEERRGEERREERGETRDERRETRDERRETRDERRERREETRGEERRGDETRGDDNVWSGLKHSRRALCSTREMSRMECGHPGNCLLTWCQRVFPDVTRPNVQEVGLYPHHKRPERVVQ